MNENGDISKRDDTPEFLFLIATIFLIAFSSLMIILMILGKEYDFFRTMTITTLAIFFILLLIMKIRDSRRT